MLINRRIYTCKRYTLKDCYVAYRFDECQINAYSKPQGKRIEPVTVDGNSDRSGGSGYCIKPVAAGAKTRMAREPAGPCHSLTIHAT